MADFNPPGGLFDNPDQGEFKLSSFAGNSFNTEQDVPVDWLKRPKDPIQYTVTAHSIEQAEGAYQELLSRKPIPVGEGEELIRQGIIRPPNYPNKKYIQQYEMYKQHVKRLNAARWNNMLRSRNLQTLNVPEAEKLRRIRKQHAQRWNNMLRSRNLQTLSVGSVVPMPTTIEVPFNPFSGTYTRPAPSPKTSPKPSPKPSPITRGSSKPFFSPSIRARAVSRARAARVATSAALDYEIAVLPRIAMARVAALANPMSLPVQLAAMATIGMASSIMSLPAQIEAMQQVSRFARSAAAQSLMDMSLQADQFAREMPKNFRPQIRVDSSKLNRSIKELKRELKCKAADIVNQQAYWVSINAIKFTYKTSRDKIKSDLNAQSRQMVGRTVAEALVINKKRLEGKTAGDYNLRAEEKTLINKRLKSIGYLKYSWIPAVRVFARYAKSSTGANTNGYKIHQPKSGGVPARCGVKATATIWNSLNADGSPIVDKHLNSGMDKALKKQGSLMLRYSRKQVGLSIDRFNRR